MMAKALNKTPSPRASSAQWMNRGNVVYLDGRAMLDGVDALAVEMDRKWGVDRLRLLVDDEWRGKFDRQRMLLNRAIWEGDLDDVMREAGRMKSAWRKLDALATEAGAAMLSPTVWETTLEDGRVVAIVPGNAEAHAVIAEKRHVEVYTLDEIARIIFAFPAMSKAKQVFPGIRVIRANEPGDPLRSVELDDEIPF